jgi:hypothetical protein
VRGEAFAGQKRVTGTSQKLSLFLLAFAFAPKQYFSNKGLHF